MSKLFKRMICLLLGLVMGITATVGGLATSVYYVYGNLKVVDVLPEDDDLEKALGDLGDYSAEDLAAFLKRALASPDSYDIGDLEEKYGFNLVDLINKAAGGDKPLIDTSSEENKAFVDDLKSVSLFSLLSGTVDFKTFLADIPVGAVLSFIPSSSLLDADSRAKIRRYSLGQLLSTDEVKNQPGVLTALSDVAIGGLLPSVFEKNESGEYVAKEGKADALNLFANVRLGGIFDVITGSSDIGTEIVEGGLSSLGELSFGDLLRKVGVSEEGENASDLPSKLDDIFGSAKIKSFFGKDVATGKYEFVIDKFLSAVKIGVIMGYVEEDGVWYKGEGEDREEVKGLSARLASLNLAEAYYALANGGTASEKIHSLILVFGDLSIGEVFETFGYVENADGWTKPDGTAVESEFIKSLFKLSVKDVVGDEDDELSLDNIRLNLVGALKEHCGDMSLADGLGDIFDLAFDENGLAKTDEDGNFVKKDGTSVNVFLTRILDLKISELADCFGGEKVDFGKLASTIESSVGGVCLGNLFGATKIDGVWTKDGQEIGGTSALLYDVRLDGLFTLFRELSKGGDFSYADVVKGFAPEISLGDLVSPVFGLEVVGEGDDRVFVDKNGDNLTDGLNAVLRLKLWQIAAGFDKNSDFDLKALIKDIPLGELVNAEKVGSVWKSGDKVADGGLADLLDLTLADLIAAEEGNKNLSDAVKKVSVGDLLSFILGYDSATNTVSGGTEVNEFVGRFLEWDFLSIVSFEKDEFKNAENKLKYVVGKLDEQFGDLAVGEALRPFACGRLADGSYDFVVSQLSGVLNPVINVKFEVFFDLLLKDQLTGDDIMNLVERIFGDTTIGSIVAPAVGMDYQGGEYIVGSLNLGQAISAILDTKVMSLVKAFTDKENTAPLIEKLIGGGTKGGVIDLGYKLGDYVTPFVTSVSYDGTNWVVDNNGTIELVYEPLARLFDVKLYDVVDHILGIEKSYTADEKKDFFINIADDLTVKDILSISDNLASSDKNLLKCLNAIKLVDSDGVANKGLILDLIDAIGASNKVDAIIDVVDDYLGKIKIGYVVELFADTSSLPLVVSDITNVSVSDLLKIKGKSGNDMILYIVDTICGKTRTLGDYLIDLKIDALTKIVNKAVLDNLMRNDSIYDIVNNVLTNKDVVALLEHYFGSAEIGEIAQIALENLTVSEGVWSNNGKTMPLIVGDVFNLEVKNLLAVARAKDKDTRTDEIVNLVNKITAGDTHTVKVYIEDILASNASGKNDYITNYGLSKLTDIKLAYFVALYLGKATIAPNENLKKLFDMEIGVAAFDYALNITDNVLMGDFMTKINKDGSYNGGAYYNTVIDAEGNAKKEWYNEKGEKQSDLMNTVYNAPTSYVIYAIYALTNLDILNDFQLGVVAAPLYNALFSSNTFSNSEMTLVETETENSYVVNGAFKEVFEEFANKTVGDLRSGLNLKNLFLDRPLGDYAIDLFVSLLKQPKFGLEGFAYENINDEGKYETKKNLKEIYGVILNLNVNEILENVKNKTTNDYIEDKFADILVGDALYDLVRALTKGMFGKGYAYDKIVVSDAGDRAFDIRCNLETVIETLYNIKLVDFVNGIKGGAVNYVKSIYGDLLVGDFAYDIVRKVTKSKVGKGLAVDNVKIDASGVRSYELHSAGAEVINTTYNVKVSSIFDIIDKKTTAVDFVKDLYGDLLVGDLAYDIVRKVTKSKVGKGLAVDNVKVDASGVRSYELGGSLADVVSATYNIKIDDVFGLLNGKTKATELIELVYGDLTIGDFVYDLLRKSGSKGVAKALSVTATGLAKSYKKDNTLLTGKNAKIVRATLNLTLKDLDKLLKNLNNKTALYDELIRIYGSLTVGEAFGAIAEKVVAKALKVEFTYDVSDDYALTVDGNYKEVFGAIFASSLEDLLVAMKNNSNSNKALEKLFVGEGGILTDFPSGDVIAYLLQTKALKKTFKNTSIEKNSATGKWLVNGSYEKPFGILFNDVSIGKLYAEKENLKDGIILPYLGSVKAGELLGGIYDETEGVWYDADGVTKTELVGAEGVIKTKVYGLTVSELLDTEFNVMDEFNDIYVGELLGYSFCGYHTYTTDSNLKKYLACDEVGHADNFHKHSDGKLYTKDAASATAQIALCDQADHVDNLHNHDLTCSLDHAIHSADGWIAEGGNKIAVLESALADLPLGYLTSGSLDFADMLSGVTLGDAMGMYKCDGTNDGCFVPGHDAHAVGCQTGWYEKDGDSYVYVGLLLDKIADKDLGEVFSNGLDLAVVFDGVLFGDIMGYKYCYGASDCTYAAVDATHVHFSTGEKVWFVLDDNGTTITTDDEWKRATTLETILANIEMKDVINGTFSIEDEIKDVRIGQLMGYEYCDLTASCVVHGDHSGVTEAKWYERKADGSWAELTSALILCVTDFTMNDMRQGDSFATALSDKIKNNLTIKDIFNDVTSGPLSILDENTKVGEIADAIQEKVKTAKAIELYDAGILPLNSDYAASTAAPGGTLEQLDKTFLSVLGFVENDGITININHDMGGSVLPIIYKISIAYKPTVKAAATQAKTINESDFETYKIYRDGATVYDYASGRKLWGSLTIEEMVEVLLTTVDGVTSIA